MFTRQTKKQTTQIQHNMKHTETQGNNYKLQIKQTKVSHKLYNFTLHLYCLIISSSVRSTNVCERRFANKVWLIESVSRIVVVVVVWKVNNDPNCPWGRLCFCQCGCKKSSTKTLNFTGKMTENINSRSSLPVPVCRSLYYRDSSSASLSLYYDLNFLLLLFWNSWHHIYWFILLVFNFLITKKAFKLCNTVQINFHERNTQFNVCSVNVLLCLCVDI